MSLCRNLVITATDMTTTDGKIDAAQADIGNPSTRTNFKTLEAMLGVEDAANASVDDLIRSGFVSGSAITSGSAGSLMEAVKFANEAIVTGFTSGSAITSGSAGSLMEGIKFTNEVLVTGYDSSAITSGSAGSIMEMLKYIIEKVDAL